MSNCVKESGLSRIPPKSPAVHASFMTPVAECLPMPCKMCVIS